VALHHLARDLGIARLVGADEADDLQSSEEEKPAECDERQQVGGATCALLESA